MASQFVRKITDTTINEPIKETTTSGDLIITKDDKVLINLNGTLKYLTADKDAEMPVISGRNYVLKSNVSTTSKLSFYSSVPSSYFSHKILTVSVQLDYENITSLSNQKRIGVEFTILNKDGSMKYINSWKYPTIGDSFHGRISTTFDFSNNEFKDYETNKMGGGIYIQGITGTNISVSNPKLEIGNVATDWSPAPEDIQSDIVTANTAIKKNADDIKAANTNIKKNTDDITQLKADIEALKSAE